ncbi:low temperature requirement protein A [Rhizocola hellebori]|nr:low temperature requirement protein A [Rhizocola hellebori]
MAIRREVSPLELFYDLVFVFAVSQLSHHLVEHLSWRGAAQTLVLLIAVCGTWAYTTFEATLLDIRRSSTRWSVVVAMGLGLFMNAAIARAFEDSAWLFVVPLLLILLILIVVSLIRAPDPVMRGHSQRVLVWMAVYIPLWLVGAAADPGARLWWWGAAALIDMTGTWLGHPVPGHVLRSANIAFDAGHMLERMRLFIIILLGETVLTVGGAISDVHVDVATIVASVGVFVALVCLWAAYFGGGEDVVHSYVTTTSDPIRAARWGINVTYGVLAGLVAVAVGSELVIAHPLGHGSATLALLLFGGTILYLTFQAWFYRVTTHRAWGQRIAACFACAAAGVAALWLPPLASVALLDAILITLVLVLTRVHQRLAGELRPAAEAS